MLNVNVNCMFFEFFSFEYMLSSYYRVSACRNSLWTWLSFIVVLDYFISYQACVLKSGEEKWRRSKRNCKSALRTIRGHQEIKEIAERNVNHESAALTANKLIGWWVSATAKCKSTENSCETPSKIIRTEIKEVDWNIVCWNQWIYVVR